jgi:fructosamine-3-kinase
MSVADTFVKRDPKAPAGFFEAEARGLRWLGQVAEGIPVVEVVDVSVSQIVLRRLHPVTPTTTHAEQLGRMLARTHQASAPVWGRDDGDGFIGPLPLANGPFESWAALWWAGRIEPYLRRAVDARLLSGAEATGVEHAVHRSCLEVPAAAPRRVHGDLWAGNVVWTASGPVLIDAASAHGGHPESDLAMLALFGLAHLDRVVAAYHEVRPLPAGWRERTPLLQLHPLLVHVVLFGHGYVRQVREAVRSLG